MGRESLSSSKPAASSSRRAGGRATSVEGDHQEAIGQNPPITPPLHPRKRMRIPALFRLPESFPTLGAIVERGREEHGGRSTEGLFIKGCLFWRVRKKTLLSHAVVFQRGFEAAAD